MKKALVSTLACLTITASLLSGCATVSVNTGSSGDASASSGKEHVTLQFIYPQNNPANDWDEAMQVFEDMTKDELNVSLNATITGFDDIGQKVSLKLTTGEEMDSVFTAQWTSPTIQEMALKGQLVCLDEYFNNDAYPGLKKAFDEEYLKQNSFLGEDGEYHIYAIPFAHEYGTLGTYVYYRLDLAKEMGLDELQNFDDLMEYYAAIQENHPEMIPYVSLGMDGFLDVASLETFTPSATDKHNYRVNVGTPSYVIKDDGTAYVSRNVVPYLDEEFVSYLPEGSYDAEDPLWKYHAARDWYERGIVSADVMNITDHQGMFCNGKAASFVRGIDTYTAINSQLMSSVSGAELGVVDIGVFSNTEHQTGCTFQAWNFAAIPVTCKHVDRVMEFYNWIFEDQSHLDLFEYGIEGKHWVAVGDDAYTPQENPDTGKTWNFESYVMTWNPTMRRYDSTTPESVITELKKAGEATYFYKYADAGFSFNSDPIKTTAAKVDEIMSELDGLKNGTIADIEGTIDTINGELESAGYEEYCAEYEKQLNEYLAENPYEGQ